MEPSKIVDKYLEEGFTGATQEKRYFEVDGFFVKRTLRQHEWPENDIGWKPPANQAQRWKTDAAVLQHLREKTNIPLPPRQSTFELDGAFYFSSELVPGVSMRSLTEEQKQIVTKELLTYLKELKDLKSDIPGVPGETLLCPPYRTHIGFWHRHSCWRLKPGVTGSYVFCHNDLGQHNVLVDPDTLKITAIVDWEFGGFWPDWFEQPYWKRDGPGAPLEGEDDDIQRLRDWLSENCEEVEMAHLQPRKAT